MIKYLTSQILKFCLILLSSSMLYAVNDNQGDVLTLLNSKTFSGTVIKIKNCQIIFKSNGIKYKIPANDIYSLKFNDPKNSLVYENYINTNQDKCMKGSYDADNLHGGAGTHYILGVLFGPFAVIGSYLGNPTPQKGSRTYMMSENKKIFDDPTYLNCYKKKAVNNNAMNASLGWLLWLVILVV